MADEPDTLIDLSNLEIGAAVEAVDHAVGTVEGVTTNPRGAVESIIVRHGYADYLLAVPVSLVAEATPGLIRLNVRLDDVEQTVFDQHADAGPTLPSPPVDEVIGSLSTESPQGKSTS